MALYLHEHNYCPFCRSIEVLAKKIGVDLNLITVNLQEGENKGEAYLQLNPFHTVPTLVDDGFILFESRAIMTYLVSKYAPDSDLYPKDLQKRALVDAMLSFDAGSLAATLTGRVRSIVNSGKDLEESAQVTGKDNLKSFDLLLSRRKYAAGDTLTLADIAIVHTLTLAEVLEVELSQFPNVHAYYQKIREDLGQVYNDVNDQAIANLAANVKSKKSE